MVLIAYRHGLRVAELVTLRWDSIDFGHGRLHVNRAKQHTGTTDIPLTENGRRLAQRMRPVTTSNALAAKIGRAHV